MSVQVRESLYVFCEPRLKVFSPIGRQPVGCQLSGEQTEEGGGRECEFDHLQGFECRGQAKSSTIHIRQKN